VRALLLALLAACDGGLPPVALDVHSRTECLRTAPSPPPPRELQNPTLYQPII
jgi:hypothetical protein